VLKKKKKNHALFEDYLAKASDTTYVEILKAAYADMNKRPVQKVIDSTTLQFPISPVLAEKDSAKQIVNLLKIITTQTANNLIQKKEKVEKKKAVKKQVEKIIIKSPDFSKYARITSIEGKINRTTSSRPEIIINTNPLLREETSFLFPNQEGRDFHFDIPLKSSTTATIKLGKQGIDLYLQPAYNLKIAINGSDLYRDLSFSGKGSDINNYLVTAARLFKHTAVELEANIRYAEPNAFKAFLNKVRLDKLQFLRTYLESHTLSEEVVKYAHADINYWFAFNLMNYPYEHPIFQNQPAPMPLPPNYYDFMDGVVLNNAGALPNKYYIYYLQDHLSYQAAKPENKGKSRFELADKYLRGKPLFFYKALQHSVNVKRLNNAKAERMAYDFINNCPYQLYGEFVKLAYHESRGIVKGMDAPDFELVDADGKSVKLSDYKGKVVFLDFWATWCKPCLRLVPAHQKLQHQFENDNVVFLYISTDRNATNWRNYVRKGTFPGKHLLGTTKMTEQYKVETLPYSLLIDTEGKIVWHHTGGFSVERTTQRILELLQ
ncbi:MAG: TlpA family protein disulfide reductase, partial [Saprospiraceae bacterium]